MQGISQGKQRILFVITKSNWGGAQRYVYDLAINLPKEKFDVVVAHGGNGELVEKLQESNIRTIEVGSLARNIKITKELTVFRTLVRLFKTEQPDIVHLNSSKIGGLGSLAARLAKVKRIVFTAHGWAFNEKRNPFFRLLIYIASWFTSLFSHRIVSVSYTDMKSSLGLPFAGKKLRMIHNGIETHELHKKTDARNFFKNKYNLDIPENKILIGTIAELHKNKGIEYAIEALSLLKQKKHNVAYVVAGEGEEHSALTASIQKYNLEDSVFLLGHIPQASEYMCAFDMFILPSLKEGLPYVLLEAGLAKVPVIASNVGGIPEIIDHETSGFLVNPQNIKDLSHYIDELFHKSELRKKFGEELYKCVTTDFTLKKMVGETVNVYTE